jgi:hypothetical protein
MPLIDLIDCVNVVVDMKIRSERLFEMSFEINFEICFEIRYFQIYFEIICEIFSSKGHAAVLRLKRIEMQGLTAMTMTTTTMMMRKQKKRMVD